MLFCLWFSMCTPWLWQILCNKFLQLNTFSTVKRSFCLIKAAAIDWLSTQIKWLQEKTKRICFKGCCWDEVVLCRDWRTGCKELRNNLVKLTNRIWHAKKLHITYQFFCTRYTLRQSMILQWCLWPINLKIQSLSKIWKVVYSLFEYHYKICIFFAFY